MKEAMSDISGRQRAILVYMREFFEENDQLPTLDAIAREFEVTINAANYNVKRLEKFKHIERNSIGRYRFARKRVLPALNSSVFNMVRQA